MNILGLVFPASFFPQSGQQQISEINESKTKCSDVGYISRILISRTKESPQGAKSQENPIYNRSSKKSFDDFDKLSRHPSDAKISSGLVSNSSTVDEPIKGASKKKKKKKNKGKLNKTILVNGAGPEATDLAILTSASTRSSSKEIDNSVENKMAAKCDGTCSQFTLSSEGSKHLLKFGDININEVRSDSAVLKDSTFGHNKVDHINDIALVRKQDKNSATAPRSADVRSVTACEAMGVFLQDARDSNLMGSHIKVPYGEQRSTGTCRNSANQITSGTEKSNMRQDEVIAGCDDCATEWKPEATRISKSMDSVEHGTTNLRTVMGVKEAGRDDNIEEVKSGKQCSMAGDARTIAPSRAVEHDKGHSQTLVDTSGRPSRATNHKQIGKENARFVWQKARKDIGGLQNNGRNRSNDENPWIDDHSADTTTQLKENSVTDGLFPPPPLPYTRRDDFRQRVKNSGITDYKKLGTRRHVLVESPQWDFRQRFDDSLGQYGSRSTEDNVFGNTTSARPKYKLTQPWKQENVNHCQRGFWISKASLSKPWSGSQFPHREVLEVPRTINLHRSSIAGQSSYENYDYSETHELEHMPSFFAHYSHVQLHEPCAPTSGHHKLLCEIQPHFGTNIPTTEDIKGEAFSRGQKWVPVAVGKKDSLMMENNRDIDTNTGRKVNVNRETDSDVCVAASTMNTLNGMKQYDGVHNGITNTPMYIGSDMAVRNVDDACRLLIASERVQLATGSPIAEFEKLIYSVSPVIIPSVIQQQHDDVIRYQPEFQNPNVLLRDVWTWYEEPGNYGLEVKAEDSQNLERLETNVVSFSAHFVPFLSAVQLFRRSCHSDSNSALCSSDGPGVIFEYFEHEPPQQRKPLYSKIKELVQGGASNPQVFGDPSNLDCMNLQDLHPTSWYSVAWYPIYRIPEGSLRASFLTYHSLGHLVSRPNKSGSMEKSAFCVVSPVLGLQSYNAQGECWFYSKKPEAESLSKGGVAVDSSKILQERLRTLAGTAALFARGHVRKDRIQASNRHPDYEFFLSRKQ